MTVLTLAAQVLGFAGFGLMLYAYSRSSRLRLVAIEAAGLTLVGLHWVLLGSLAGALSGLVLVSVNLASYRLEADPRVRRAYWLLYPVAVGVTGAGYASPLDLMVVAATLLLVVSRHTTNLTRLRYVAMSASVIWFTFGVLTGSLPQICFSILAIASHLRMLYFRPQPQPAPAPAPAPVS